MNRALSAKMVAEKTTEFLKKSRRTLFENATEMKNISAEWQGYEPSDEDWPEE